ncbi:MAG: NUDIX domain-containing protein [Ignavibacteriae bacterium]|nr:NUDIX domain-containing protein [Ignavibacteriota bacterium]
MLLKLPQSIEQISNNSLYGNLQDNWSGAVTVLIVEDSILFIRRSESMPTHKGQIGFMGGHKHKGENSPIETAKREFEEESGLGAENLNVLGLLDPVITSRGKIIIPVIARGDFSKEHILSNATSNGEWDNLIFAPKKYLSSQNIWSKGQYIVEKQYSVYFAPLALNICHYLYPETNPYLLWGASAKMILNFFKYDVSCDKNLKN